MFTVYILYSEKLDQFHIDSTWVDLEEELKSHNTGNRFQTSGGLPWTLIWYKQMPVKDGVEFISTLKRLSRSRFIRAFRKTEGSYPGKGKHPTR